VQAAAAAAWESCLRLCRLLNFVEPAPLSFVFVEPVFGIFYVTSGAVCQLQRWQLLLQFHANFHANII
jgi:hypothetical protein